MLAPRNDSGNNSDHSHTAKSRATYRERSLIIGDQRIKLSSITEKMRQDIVFLTSRIKIMEQQADPNLVLLTSYESMLKSRHNVMQWLAEYSPGDETPEHILNKIQ